MGKRRCVGLGTFGADRPAFLLKWCRRQLHPLVMGNIGRRRDGRLFCRACQNISRLRWYWSEQLDAYWRTKVHLLLPPILTDAQLGASSGRWSNEDGPAVPTLAGQTQPSRDCQPTEAG